MAVPVLGKLGSLLTRAHGAVQGHLQSDAGKLSDAVVAAALDRLWVKLGQDAPEVASLLAGDEIEIKVAIRVKLSRPAAEADPNA